MTGREPGRKPLGRSSARPWAIAGLIIAALVLIGVVLVVTGVIGGDDGFDADRVAEAGRDDGADDPFAWEADRNADFERRAALGLSHVLYEKSPGGIVASARRTARWRDEIERAAADHGVDPDTMEAMVLLESAGRPEVIAGDDPEVASGLAQIVASTGIDLLDMRVDLARSRALTKQIARVETEIEKAKKQARSKKAKVRTKALMELRKLPGQEKKLRERRAEVDERFDPQQALDGMARYLEIANDRFGRTDLATTSYHMGIGNLETVISDYGDGTPPEDPTYAQLFFGSSPLANEKAWKFLSSLGDDSSTYLWRVLAAERIMELYRDDRGELERLAKLQAKKATQEEVFHPEADTTVFEKPSDIEAALDDGELERLPQGADYGYTIDKNMGELAPNVGAEPGNYRALKPEALAALIYMTARVQEINDGKGVLNVTSTVRDQEYQDALVDVNDQATPAYSLHTTGWSFDIERKYSSDRQAQAFQFMLDRLRALDVIDYAYEPDAIHVTVSDEAKPLLDP
ncbi:MAG: transglycosylase SLT domain-containing protein [Solirubrobacterales bacterium]